MSSFQSSGLAAMNSRIRRMHSGSLRMSNCTPRERTITLRPLKRLVLADHDPADAIEQHGPAAHVAGRKGRIEHRPAIVACRQPTAVFQAIHLGMQDGTAALHPAVMPTADDLIIDHQHRTDGDAPFGEPQLRFFDGRLQEFVHPHPVTLQVMVVWLSLDRSGRKRRACRRLALMATSHEAL